LRSDIGMPSFGCGYDAGSPLRSDERQGSPVSARHFPSKLRSQRNRPFHAFRTPRGPNCGGAGTNLRLAGIC
jgi:hypothetical protein